MTVCGLQAAHRPTIVAGLLRQSCLIKVSLLGGVWMAKQWLTPRGRILRELRENRGFRWVIGRYISRARSLRNLLVSGNECGRVFPAGVGPGSPSRDAANWLPSRFSLSVETRRRYGWLRMMVFPGARLFPSPNLVPFGRVAARERQGALSRRAW